MRSVSPWRRGLTLVTTVAAAVALSLTGPPASARPSTDQAAATAPQAVSHSKALVGSDAWAAGRAKYGPNVTAAQAVAAFWTPARMRAARPIEETAAYQDAVRKYGTASKSAPERGAPKTIEPATGHLGLPGPAPAAWNPNYPPEHPTARTSGKVFFSTPGGTAQCSATIINSEGRNTVWTAGHCVHGGAGGDWYWNWQFVPSYDDDLANPAPYGVWTAAQLWSLNSWITSTDFSSDMGVAIMGTLDGWHIVDYFGGQGLQVNAGVPSYQYAFGYPAEAPFDGGNLWGCDGSSAWFETETYYIPCDLTRGSSGGGHLRGWDGNWGYLNGLNSRIDQIVNPTIMISPYFDNTALDLYNGTRNL
jgi:hypothetical protein